MPPKLTPEQALNAAALKPKEISSVTITDARSAIISYEYESRADGARPPRWVIGRRLVGNAQGLSAFRFADTYAPDVSKIPPTGSVTLTLNSAGLVIGVQVIAIL